MFDSRSAFSRANDNTQYKGSSMLLVKETPLSQDASPGGGDCDTGFVDANARTGICDISDPKLT